MYLHNPKYFITIVECGSLTKAAEKLFVSQPSLSKYVKRLENNLGIELFDRTSSPLRMTFAGERYYKYILNMQRLNQDLQKEFQDIKKDLRGRIRLGVALWRGACLLPDVFPEFHKKYPNIEIELFEGRSNQLESALLNDNIDMAVMNLPRVMNYTKLSCETIFEEPILLAASTEHPVIQELLKNCEYKGKYPVAPVEILSQLPILMTKPGQNLTIQINYFLAKNQIEVNTLMTTSNLTTAINLVSKGMGATFVPGEGASVCSRPGKVTYFLIDSPDMTWPLAIVYRKEGYLPELSRIFKSELKEVLEGQVF